MLPMALPIIVVAVILQVTGIWNDFLFGLVFAGRDNLPMTVQLNNIVNSTQGERDYNVNMAATHPHRAGAARRLFRLRALVRARHRRRRGEGLTHACRSQRLDSASLRDRLRRPEGAGESRPRRRRRASSSCCSARPAAASRPAQRHRRAARRQRRRRSRSAARTSPGRSRRIAASAWCSSPTRSIRA